MIGYQKMSIPWYLGKITRIVLWILDRRYSFTRCNNEDHV